VYYPINSVALPYRRRLTRAALLSPNDTTIATYTFCMWNATSVTAVPIDRRTAFAPKVWERV